jgi:hypothetical protein
MAGLRSGTAPGRIPTTRAAGRFQALPGGFFMLADKSAAFANMAPVAFIRSGWNTKRAGNVLDVLEEVQRQDNVVRPQKVEAQGNNQNGLDQRVRWKLLRHGGLSAPDTKLTRRGADRSRLARSL